MLKLIGKEVQAISRDVATADVKIQQQINTNKVRHNHLFVQLKLTENSIDSLKRQRQTAIFAHIRPILDQRIRELEHKASNIRSEMSKIEKSGQRPTQLDSRIMQIQKRLDSLQEKSARIDQMMNKNEFMDFKWQKLQNTVQKQMQTLQEQLNRIKR